MNKVILAIIISVVVTAISISLIFVTFEYYKNSENIERQINSMAFDEKTFEYWLAKANSTDEVMKFLEIYPDSTYSVTDFGYDDITVSFTNYDLQQNIESTLETTFYSGVDFPEFELHCVGKNKDTMVDYTVLAYMQKTDCYEMLEELDDIDFDADKILAKLLEQNAIDEFYMDLVLEERKYKMFSENFPDSEIMILDSNEKTVVLISERALGDEFSTFMMFHYDIGDPKPLHVDFACIVDGIVLYDGILEGLGLKLNQCKNELLEKLDQKNEQHKNIDKDELLAKLKNAHSIVSNHMSSGDPRLLITATFVDEQRELLVIWLDPTHVAKPWSEDDLRQYLRIDVPIELSFGTFISD